MFKKFFLLTILLTITVFLSACSFSFPWEKKYPVDPINNNINGPSNNNQEENPDQTSNNQDSFSQMKKFNNYEEFKTFLASQDLANNYNSFVKALSSDTRMTMEVADSFGLGSAMPATEQSKEMSLNSDDYSTTNVQVEGVDEADIIKTDGSYIYALVKNDLYIIKSFPANQAEITAKINFTSRPSEFYLDGNRLSVIGADNEVSIMPIPRRRYSAYTFVKTFDISDKARPTEVRTLRFEGSYQTSRLINGKLYLIVNNYLHYFASNDDVRPLLIDGTEVVSTNCADNVRCFVPDIFYFDMPYDSYNLTSINVIDIRGQADVASAQAYLLNSAQTVYVSAGNIYLTYTTYLNMQDLEFLVMENLFTKFLSQDDKALIQRINDTPNDILSSHEKKYKIQAVYERVANSLSEIEREKLETDFESLLAIKIREESSNFERTHIHRFSLKDLAPKHEAAGSVPGHVLNQFSLDEDNEGNLRIATTRQNQSWRFRNVNESSEYLSNSNLYVLSSQLELLGAVENLAPDERIYSVRFIGQRAYLVTFKQVDPLFVIDLTNPRAPRLLGELKVPGYSTYLHPYDANTLIGFGQDTTLDERGNVRTGGIKLSLFDVTNPTQPAELDSFVAGGAGSDSLALYNHKAFLFSKDKNLLMVPVFLRNYEKATATNGNFGGALVFSVDNNRFVLRGQIDHAEGSFNSNIDGWCGYGCYDNSVQRGLYIQDTLYTFSNRYLKANNLNDLSAVKSLELLKESDIVQPKPPIWTEIEPEVIIMPELNR